MAFALLMWFYPTFYGFYVQPDPLGSGERHQSKSQLHWFEDYEMAFEPDTARRDNSVKSIRILSYMPSSRFGVGMVMALGFALLINSLRKGRGLFRFVIFPAGLPPPLR